MIKQILIMSLVAIIASNASATKKSTSKPVCPKEPDYPALPEEIKALRTDILAAIYWNEDMRDAHIRKLEKFCKKVEKNNDGQ